MQTPPPIAEPNAIAATERAVIQQQVDLLGALANIGLALAEGISEAFCEERTLSGPEAALAFSRASRVVRLCVMLQGRLMAEARGLGLSIDHPLAAVAAGPALADPDIDDEPEALDVELVEAAERAETAERLLGGERLDRDDLVRLVATRPVEELIAMACRDLGLPPPDEPAFEAALQAAVREADTDPPDWGLAPMVARALRPLATAHPSG